LRSLQVMRAVSPTLVHNVTVKPVLYGTLAARMLGVPAIINAISGLGYAFSDESRWMLASVLRSAYRFVLRSPRVHVIFQNDDDAHEFVSAGLAMPGQGVLIRGSGVDLTRFHPAPEDPATPPLIVLPARMLRDKGVVEFSTAARLLGERGCRARFALAGPLDPANPAALTHSEILQFTVGAPVEWLGHVEDMPELYRRAHVVCLPSYREGLPKSLIEACAAGRPVVTTDVPGCRAVVTHGVNGLLVPARNAGALADALQRLIEDAHEAYANREEELGSDPMRELERQMAQSPASLLRDPERNIQIGCWYLEKIYEQYRDIPDPEPRVIAAYNAGPSRAAEWSKVSEGATPLSGGEFINKIEIPSTRAYVISILERYRKLKGPAQATTLASPPSRVR